MEFYSSGFYKIQQKQATGQYANSEPQKPFQNLVHIFQNSPLLTVSHEWAVKKKPFQSSW